MRTSPRRFKKYIADAAKGISHRASPKKKRLRAPKSRVCGQRIVVVGGGGEAKRGGRRSSLSRMVISPTLISFSSSLDSLFSSPFFF